MRRHAVLEVLTVLLCSLLHASSNEQTSTGVKEGRSPKPAFKLADSGGGWVLFTKPRLLATLVSVLRLCITILSDIKCFLPTSQPLFDRLFRGPSQAAPSSLLQRPMLSTSCTLLCKQPLPDMMELVGVAAGEGQLRALKQVRPLLFFLHLLALHTCPFPVRGA